ncbi:MAG: hypothetical protein ACK5Z5_08865 [Neisseriaceae bacterium]|jgi:hypothetical protein
MNYFINNYVDLLTKSIDIKSKLLKTFNNSLDSLIQQYKIKEITNTHIQQVLNNIGTLMLNNPSDHALINSGIIGNTNYMFCNTLYRLGPTKRDKNILNHPFKLPYQEEPIEHYVIRRALTAIVIHSYILKSSTKDCVVGLAELADENGILPNIKISNYKIHTIPNIRRGLCIMLPSSMNCKIKPAIFSNGDAIQVDIRNLPRIFILHRRMRNETMGTFKIPKNSLVMGDFNAGMSVDKSILATNVLNVDGQVVANDKPIDHILYFNNAGQFSIKKPHGAKCQLEIEGGSYLFHNEGYITDINGNITWVY